MKLFFSCFVIVSLQNSANANDYLKKALEEAASNVAADVTLHIDSGGLEKGLRGAIPDNLKKNTGEYDKQFLAQYPVVTDEAKVARLTRVVDSLVGQMHNKDSKFTIRLLKADEVNAFTTGGPYIYVYSALLDQIQDDDELAGILGHELAHVDAAHIPRAQAQGTWIGLGALAASKLTTGDDRNKVVEGHAAANATFSREHESEADALGALYALRSGYKTRGIATFFDRCQQNEVARRENAKKHLAELKATLDAAAKRRQASFGLDLGAYELARKNYNAYIPYHNAVMARPSPWLIDHPFDQYRKGRVMTLADYLEKKIQRKDISDSILLKVLETVEKVEGGPIDSNSHSTPGVSPAKQLIAAGVQAEPGDSKPGQDDDVPQGSYMQGVWKEEAAEKARALKPGSAIYLQQAGSGHLVKKAKEEEQARAENKYPSEGDLGAIRTAISIYTGDHQGTPPPSLEELALDGKYLRVIPGKKYLIYDSKQGLVAVKPR